MAMCVYNSNNDDDNNNNNDNVYNNNNGDDRNKNDNINNDNKKKQEDMILLWNQGLQTNAEIVSNRPVAIITHKRDKIFILIDVAIPLDTNIIQKESEKKSKKKKKN
jgi:hypothetical protein